MSRHPFRKRQRGRSLQVTVPQQQPFEEKANPAYASIVMMGDVPQPHSMPRNYKSFAENGFAESDSVFKCVTYISQNGAAISPVLYTDDTKKKKIEKHPLLDKLNKPNPEIDGVLYRESVLGWYLIAGNSFQYAIRKGKSGPPDELWVLEVTKVHPLPSKVRGIIGYDFDDFPSEMNPIAPENIGHMRSWNPKSPIFGLSAMEPGAIKVDMQLASQKWNLSVMQQSGRMAGAFTTDAILSPNDRSTLEGKIKDKFAGYRNAGRIPVLDGGLKWQSMAMSPSDMDWLESLKYNAGALANLYNIPPQLIGDTSSTTYDNMEQAKAASYTEAIFPALDKLYSLLNNWLVPMYPDLQNAYLYYDKDSVEVVQAVIQQQKDAKAKRAFQAWAIGAASSCTLNEAREMQGLPADPQGNIYRFGQVIVKVGELDTYAEQSLQKPAAPPMPVPEPELNLSDPNQPPPEPTPTKPGKPPKGEQQESEQEPPPKKPGKKSADDVEYAQSDDKAPKKWVDPTVDERLADYADRQVTHLRWVCDGDPCDVCKQNDGVVVEVGQAFPSGDLMPKVHFGCQCKVVEMSAPQFGMMRRPNTTLHKSIDDVLASLEESDEEDATNGRGQSREEYRDFMRRVMR